MKRAIREIEEDPHGTIKPAYKGPQQNDRGVRLLHSIAEGEGIMTGQERDEEWVKGKFEQLQCATGMDPRWKLANPKPLKFEIPRLEETVNSLGGPSYTTVKDQETGILLYSTEFKEYSGFFPGDGEEATRTIQCINGSAFDTGDQKDTGLAIPGSPDAVGTCVVVDS